jgi:hypothetical protein
MVNTGSIPTSKIPGASKPINRARKNQVLEILNLVLHIQNAIKIMVDHRFELPDKGDFSVHQDCVDLVQWMLQKIPAKNDE